VKIPLPGLLRTLREQQVERKLRPWTERAALRIWAALALRPRLYAFATGFAVRVLHWMGGRRGSIARLPFDPGWTQGRDFPAPQGRTFRKLYAEYQRASHWRRA
jgi:L-lactate dehydrogenase complex protein LldF